MLLGAGGTGFGLLALVATRESPIGYVLTLLGAVRLVGWFFLTYQALPEELVIRAGVLQRRTQIVPYHRVQQIDFRRGLVAQLFGLTEMRIDTAGSAEGRVTLAYLDAAVGERLRDLILERRALAAAGREPVPDGAAPVGSNASGAAPPMPSARIVELDPLSLAWGGVTSDRAVLVVVAVLVVWPIALILASTADASGQAWVGAALALPLYGALIVLGLAALHTLQYWNLTVDLVGEDLRVEYGLLERQHLTLPRSRVQHVAIGDNLVRRRLDLVTVSLHSAAPTGTQNPSRLLIDGVHRSLADDLLAASVEGAGPGADLALTARTGRARRRGIIRRVVVLLPIGVLPIVRYGPVGVLSFAVALVGVSWGRRAHERAGHAATEELVVLAAGAIVHRRAVVPRSRVQSVRVISSWFQRRAGLATLALDVAGAAPQLYDMEVSLAQSLARDLAEGRRGGG